MKKFYPPNGIQAVYPKCKSIGYDHCCSKYNGSSIVAALVSRQMVKMEDHQACIDYMQQHFQAVIALDPHNWMAHWQMLQSLCAKWGGSHERMQDFAQRSADVESWGAPKAIASGADWFVN